MEISDPQLRAVEDEVELLLRYFAVFLEKHEQ